MMKVLGTMFLEPHNKASCRSRAVKDADEVVGTVCRVESRGMRRCRQIDPS